jgi:peptide/nickel transport system ATP-binding protein/oligopeptide transport system ATP-binding protein
MNLLTVKDLKVHFPVRSGLLQRVTDHVKAVDGITFDIPQGSCVGLVGESGSGKSTTGKAIIGLNPTTAGSIHYESTNLSGLSTHHFLPFRKKIQMVFQDPFNSLNPRMRVEALIGEPLEIHFPQMKRDERRDRVSELLTQVGLDPKFIDRYPHAFSGGQRQRIGIARALAVKPEFIILDEPVSALDVSVQAQIINLLADLKEEFNLTYLFISHDLAVVEHFCNYTLVMNEGKLVEQGKTESVLNNPQDAYTRRLIDAVPSL